MRMHIPAAWSRVTLLPGLAIVMRGLLQCAQHAPRALLLLGLAASLAAQAAENETASIDGVLPEGLSVVKEMPSGVDGVNLVELSDGGLIHAFDGKPFFFSGDLYQITDSGVANVTERYRAGQRVDILGAIDPGEAVIFPAKREPVETLWVFTDVTCGYCQLFHQQMAAYNDLGLEVRYLAFPRFGVDSESGELLETAWCAKDRQDAITRLKAGDTLSNKTCENPVAEHFNLGQRLGVRGTPAIFSSAGVQLPGFVPPEEIMGRLGIEGSVVEQSGG